MADSDGKTATSISTYYTIGGVTVNAEKYRVYSKFARDYESATGEELIIDTIEPYGKEGIPTYSPYIISVSVTTSTTYLQGIASDFGNTLSDSSTFIGGIVQGIADNRGYRGDVNTTVQMIIQGVSAFVPGLFIPYTECILTIQVGYIGIPNEDKITRKFSIPKDADTSENDEKPSVTVKPSGGSSGLFKQWR